MENLTSNIQRLKFAIRFAAMDLAALRPGDWLNLQDDLASFLGCKRGQGELVSAKGAIRMTPLAHPLPYEYTESDFRTLQRETNTLLQSLAYEDMLSAEMLDIHAHVGIVSLPPTGWTISVAQGGTRDMFLLYLWLLIREEGIGHIKRCPEPKCGAIFYRIKKQKYCSRTCTNRATVRAWRQHEEVKKNEREKAHQYYKDGRPKNTQKQVRRRPRGERSA